jgi:hypothetical protein
VTAQDDLYRLACSDMPVTGSEVNEAIIAFAHELAEMLRQDTTATGEVNDQYALLYADLIERTVRAAATEGDTT